MCNKPLKIYPFNPYHTVHPICLTRDHLNKCLAHVYTSQDHIICLENILFHEKLGAQLENVYKGSCMLR